MENLDAPTTGTEKETGIFEITSDNTIYSLEISKSKNEKNDAVCFKAFDKEHFSNIFYTNSFNLEQLITFSKIFKLCDNIDNAFDIILKTFKGQEVKITKDDKIYLCIGFQLPTNKFEDIKIPLEKGKMEDSLVIEKICQNLTEIKEKNKKLEEEVKLLKIENQKLSEKINKNKDECLIDIMREKFVKSKYTLTKDLSSHLTEFGLQDDFKKEITKKFESSKAKVIYDVKKDGDTLVAFITKVFGKKNIASFHSIHGVDKFFSVQLAYLHGKLEFINNYFNFEKNDLFTYGNYQVYESDFCYTSFKAQNSKLYVKIEFDCIYVIFYENDNINFIIKIRDNFVNNPILCLDEGDDKIEKFFETNGEEKVGELFNTSKSTEITLSELVIYQIED